MTKTLTEQWREGTLPAGFYYLKMKDGLILTDHTIYIVGEKQYRFELSSIDYVSEVLEPVPSYDSWRNHRKTTAKTQIKNCDLEIKLEQLEKRLEIATKALNGIRDVWANNPNKFSYIARIANRKAKTALEEMEGVK